MLRHIRLNIEMAHIGVDALGSGPIRLNGDELEAMVFDELAGDARPHAIELRAAMGGLNEQDDACAADALQQGIDRRAVRVIEGLGGLGQDPGDREGHWRVSCRLMRFIPAVGCHSVACC